MSTTVLELGKQHAHQKVNRVGSSGFFLKQSLSEMILLHSKSLKLFRCVGVKQSIIRLQKLQNDLQDTQVQMRMHINLNSYQHISMHLKLETLDHIHIFQSKTEKALAVFNAYLSLLLQVQNPSNTAISLSAWMVLS